MKFRWVLVLVLLVNSLPVTGQKYKYVLNGQMHVTNGETYLYKLSFNTKDTTFSGSAVTVLPDGSQPELTIKGHINKKRHLITFSEKKLVSELPPNVSMCLVDATLKYHTCGKKVFSGTFTGKDRDNRPCGKGTIDFERTKLTDELFSVDTIVQKKAIELAKTVEQKGETEITSGVSKQYDWYSDTCMIELYDGGIIDGDEISLVFNNHTLLDDFPLKKQKKTLKLQLQKGVNTITIVAGYEGKIPPNTANITISSGKVHYRIKANNAPGDKATIILNRK